jgi:acetolactate synthase-1/3 small subunit
LKMIASATEPLNGAAPPNTQRPMKHTISVLVDNTPGVLMKVAGLFRRRGYNIHSLAVGVTEQTTVSRMIIVVEGEPEILEQIIKQLNKLIEVIKVNDVTGFNTVDRELALIKLNATPQSRMEIMEISNVFRASVVDLTEKTMTLEVTGRSDKIDAILSLLSKYGVREMVRTGQVTLVRGTQPT